MAIPLLTFSKIKTLKEVLPSIVQFTRSGATPMNAQLVSDAAMGEAVSSPTAYTVLGRLKAIATALAAGVPVLGWGWTSVFGVSSAVVISADASGAGGVAITDAPGASLKIVVDSVIISSGAAITVDLQEETSGTKIAQFYMAANTTVVFKPEGKVKLATANKKLMVHASGAGNVAVTAVYHVEA